MRSLKLPRATQRHGRVRLADGMLQIVQKSMERSAHGTDFIAGFKMRAGV